MKQVKIGIGLIAGGLLLGGILFVTLSQQQQFSINNNQLPTADPLDFVLDFYSAWQQLLLNEQDPFQSDFFSSGVFSNQFSNQLTTQRTTDSTFDPVTCQTVIADRVRVRPLTNTGSTVTILVESRIGQDSLPLFSLVSLKAVAGDWQIHDIECTPGDVPPDVDFSFERSGYLLKEVPPPYERGVWHLVYEQDGQMGFVVPLLFDADSTCVVNGVPNTCNLDNLVETAEVMIKGEMTEVGVQVIELQQM